MSLIRWRYASRVGYLGQRNRLGRRWTARRDARQIWLEHHGGYPVHLTR